MYLELVEEAAGARANEVGGHQRRHSAGEVHDAGAGKVLRNYWRVNGRDYFRNSQQGSLSTDGAVAEQRAAAVLAAPRRGPAVGCPAPVDDDRVDEAGEDHRDGDVHVERDALLRRDLLTAEQQGIT